MIASTLQGVLRCREEAFSEFVILLRRTRDIIFGVTVKTRIKEQVFWEFRLILFLYIGCFLPNQPENVFKMFSLKLFL